MLLRTAAASALVLALLAAPARAQPQDPVAAIDAVFAPAIAADAPGCVISVVQDGRATAERAYGSADLEHDVALTPSAILETGSVAKQFVGAAVLLLVQDGKLSLTDDVRKHAPELPDYGHVVTIDMLLNHTSGLRDWGTIAEMQGWPRGTRAHTQGDALEILKRQRSLNYPAGTDWDYTNSGYNLLTEIIARVSGQSLADFTRDRLFRPLGMSSSSWRDDYQRVVKGRAVAYGRADSGRFEQRMPFENVHGNGGMLTTVADLQRWNAALDTGALGPFVTAELQRRARLKDGKQIVYARGLFVDRYRGAEEIAHGGSTAGYQTWLGRYPAQKLSIALLCNGAHLPAGALAHRVADLFLPAAPAEPAATPVVLADLAGRAGIFAEERTGRAMTLVVRDGALAVADGPALPATAADRVRMNDRELTFDGRDRFRVIARHRGAPVWRRVAPAGVIVPAEYAGLYRSDEVGAAYAVEAEGGALTLRIDGRPGSTQTLKPAYRDGFLGDDGLVVRFRRDRAGRVSGLSAGLARAWDVPFAKVSAKAAGRP